ncbi:MAG: hypothetical protein AAGG68_19415 [Bacteroidota bacterium]
MKKFYKINVGKNFSGDRKRYVQVIRLLSLIEGVNQSIHLSVKMDSPLEEKQYQHLKNQYPQNLLSLLKGYDLSLQTI